MPLHSIAAQYIGQKEIPGNRGWADADFQKIMVAQGWKMGQAWCAYFVKMCVELAREKYGEHLTNLVSPSAVTTFRNYKKAGRTSQTPVPGHIVIWQHYDAGAATIFGHAGIVSDMRPPAGKPNHFMAIEGNTTEAGVREGDGVVLKLRKTDFAKKNHGLVLLGFCNPVLA